MTIASIDHYIHGRAVANESGRSQDVTNPASGKVTGKVGLADKAAVDAAVASAQAAFPAGADRVVTVSAARPSRSPAVWARPTS